MKLRHLCLAAVILGVGLVSAADPAPRPIERARVGHWIIERHTTVISSVTTQTTYKATWVDSVEGRKVHLKQQEISADQKTGIRAATESVVDLDQKSATQPKDEDRGTTTTLDEIAIGDKIIKCSKTVVVTSDPAHVRFTTTTWISAEVPLFGLVRTVRCDTDDKELERTELVSWGESGGAELPLAEKR